MKEKSQRVWPWAAAVFIAAALLRLWLWLTYPPVPYNDTPSYWRLAQTIQAGWESYDGTRMPGYPFFLTLVGSDSAAYAVQLVLGLCTTLLFFYVGWRAGKHPAWGAAAAAAHTLNLGQLFFEPNLITETLTTFWLALCLAGLCAWFVDGKHSPWLAAAIGLTAGIAGMVRPLFLLMPFWFALWLAAPWGHWKQWRVVKNWRLAGLAAAIPGALLLGGWLTFMYTHFEVLSPTTMTGFHMMQHTGYFFEYVPDEYAALRDTYLRFREERIALYGTQGNTIWDALPEMQRVTGYSFVEMSNVLARLSTRLIWEHPDLYMKTVLKGWWYFWRAPIYWTPEAIQPQALRSLLTTLATGERLVLFAANILFAIAALPGLLWPRLRRHLTHPFLMVTGFSIWLVSVLQTLADHGDNPRFLIPMQTWVVLWVGLLCLTFLPEWLPAVRKRFSSAR
ncbi:MAG TPA: hypothetical protein PKW33_02680 [Anaerolineaceae bacterium]|nr:hypothetical protein [Anaerolineaceae bacterium]HPN50467.1 hypothetical protein [Anaerolineaceae bacterium]